MEVDSITVIDNVGKNILLWYYDYDQKPLIPAGIYLLRVSCRNTRTRWVWNLFKVNNNDNWIRHCFSGAFIVNFEHIAHLVLVFLLLTLDKQLLAETGVLRVQFPLKNDSKLIYAVVSELIFNFRV